MMVRMMIIYNDVEGGDGSYCKYNDDINDDKTDNH